MLRVLRKRLLDLGSTGLEPRVCCLVRCEDSTATNTQARLRRYVRSVRCFLPIFFFWCAWSAMRLRSAVCSPPPADTAITRRRDNRHLPPRVYPRPTGGHGRVRGTIHAYAKSCHRPFCARSTPTRPTIVGAVVVCVVLEMKPRPGVQNRLIDPIYCSTGVPFWGQSSQKLQVVLSPKRVCGSGRVG